MTVKLTPIRRPKHGPEWHLQQAHVPWMEARGWRTNSRRIDGSVLLS